MTIGKVHLTENYARYRIKNPSEFEKSSFRTQDIGRAGHSKRIAGKLKSSGKWATQAILIALPDYKMGLRLFKKGKGYSLKWGKRIDDWKKGWKLDSARHSLARKGIKTGRKKKVKKQAEEKKNQPEQAAEKKD